MKTLALIVVAAALLVTTTVSLAGISFPKSFSNGMTLVAEKLTKKPDKYIALAEPDPYVLQAISNLGEQVVVGAWKNSEFDEMVEAYETNNVEIDGNYYRIDLYSKEAFFWKPLFWASIVGWVALGSVLVVSAWKC